MKSVGAGGNDVLYGNVGDNMLTGGGDNDTFVFNLADSIGIDEILDFDAGDTLSFQNVGGAGTEADLENLVTVTNNGLGGDVVIAVDGSTDQITLTDAGYTGDSSVDGFEAAYGGDSILTS